MKFYTLHRPGQHTAHRLDGQVLVDSQPTEVDLSRALAALGIKLNACRYYNSRGDVNFNCINWETSSPSPR